MEIPLLDIVSRLDFLSFTILGILGLFLLYFMLPEKIYGLMFLLALSAAFVGSSISFVGDVCTLIRWVIILLLLMSGILFGKVKLSIGVLLFWGYGLLGFASLLNSISPLWQFQRGMLLLMVALAIPIAYGDKPYPVYKLSLVSIAIVGSIFSIYNFIPLQSQLGDAARLTGLARSASNFSMDLGGLLPFIYWGLWKSDSKWIRIFCGVGFLLGIITLALSGQRAGAIAGLVGLIPLIVLTISKREGIKKVFLFFGVTAVVCYLILQWAGTDRLDFLTGRYSINEGASGRVLIWEFALSEIDKNIFMGHGIGAAETVFPSSFHNAYLEIWFNAGIFGLVFYIAAQVYFFYRIVVSWFRYKSVEVRSILALGMGYMLGFVGLCFVESVGAAASTLNVILYLFIGVVISNDIIFKSISSETLAQLHPQKRQASTDSRQIMSDQRINGCALQKTG